MAMTLEQLVNEANQWLVPTYGHPLPLEYACRRLDTGPRASLSNPHLPSLWRPLTPDTLIFGELLLLASCSHDEDLFLTEHEDRDHVTREILSETGIFSPWIEYQIAFENGKMLP